MNKTIVARIIFSIIIILNCIFIFIFSCDNGDKSTNKSGFVVDMLLKMFPQYEQMSEAEQHDFRENLTFVVRKIAHFSEYVPIGIFGVLLLNTFAMKTKFKYLITQLFGTLYATSDEIHQLFVADRECHIRDVFIDSCGVAFGALIVILIIYLYKKHKAKKLETANITN